MNRIPIFISVSLITIAASIYHFGELFSKWSDPEYISGVITNNFASNLSESLVTEGVLYPTNDLDDPLLDYRKIVVSHALNESSAKEVVRKLLYLNDINNKSPINLYISTQGGWYDSAFTIIDTINVIEAPVNTICVGGCYSAGLLIVASGTGKRVTLSNALFSAHVNYGGNGDDRPFSNVPDRINPYLQSVAQLPSDWFPLENDRHYYFKSENALKYGVVDTILNKEKNIVNQSKVAP